MKVHPRPFWAIFPLLAFAALLGACSDDSPEPAPSPTEPAAAVASPAPTAEPTAVPAPLEPDGERILGYVRRLVDGIGPRVAGTANEDEAAGVIAEFLESFGYDVSIQDVPLRGSGRAASLIALGRTFSAAPLNGSGGGTAEGMLVLAGGGRPEEFPAQTRGNIAVVERGELQFREKVANAIAAGAVAVIIYNNESGAFLGSLGSVVEIPVLSLSQGDGQQLAQDIRNQPQPGRITVNETVSHNVIAKPPGGQCETVSGGHFDSVAGAPGASDNASGTATVIEIAAVLAQNGHMGSHCFVLWGAEEVGLVGSREFLNSLSAEERSRLRAVLNFDMVGVGDQAWWLIGTPDLQRRAQGLAEGLGIATQFSQLSGTSSDHATFLQAGIPSLMLHRWQDPLLHTPQDVSGRVRPELLEQAARLGVSLLQDLERAGG